MHTKLRLMALGVVLLGGGASVAQAEAGPECLWVKIFVECPGDPALFCESMMPQCGSVDFTFCESGPSGPAVICSWQEA